MADTPEKKVKTKVKRLLEENGVYHFSPYQAGMGRAGIPDIICCCNGRFLAVECKAGKGKTTPLQDREIEQIRSHGGVALVINENNLDELKEALEWLKTE